MYSREEKLKVVELRQIQHETCFGDKGDRVSVPCDPLRAAQGIPSERMRHTTDQQSPQIHRRVEEDCSRSFLRAWPAPCTHDESTWAPFTRTAGSMDRQSRVQLQAETLQRKADLS